MNKILIIAFGLILLCAGIAFGSLADDMEDEVYHFKIMVYDNNTNNVILSNQQKELIIKGVDFYFNDICDPEARAYFNDYFISRDDCLRTVIAELLIIRIMDSVLLDHYIEDGH